MNTIFHIDEINKWPTLLSNVNHMHEWMQSTKTAGTIEVLVNGSAVSAVVKNSDINLSQLTNMGIMVAVCNNSLVQRDIKTDSLQANLQVVPVGVVELACKQSEGYAYIKP
ncbi:DsrE family protein [Lentilactobacillus senioris]|uniref:DsrE family protein n=1 Tax=Lentilactobacillus senioris TaxID=931534 RepID=UPI00227EB1F7|nr:DsrE family protein [Lentilactobacillus senioris]MCY9807240.1 DsrE family protein [Lentilactobacillus senioris]